MTRQTYKEYLEQLETENEALRQKVLSLEVELEERNIWDKRPLDAIINEYSNGGSKQKKEVFFTPVTEETDYLSVQGVIEQYREFRKLQSEVCKVREIELDTSALGKLKTILEEKPAC